MPVRPCCVSVLLLAVFLAAPPACAEEASAAEALAPPRPLRVALLAGYGVNDSNASGGSVLDLYGPGIGARASYTFSPGLALGASFTYHTGFSKDGASGRLAPLGLEAGWDFALGVVTLRPYVGAGVAFYHSSLDGPEIIRGSGQKAAIWPGLVAMVGLGDRAFVGLEARYTLVATGNDTTVVAAGGGSADALGLYANVGARF